MAAKPTLLQKSQESLGWPSSGENDDCGISDLDIVQGSKSVYASYLPS